MSEEHSLLKTAKELIYDGMKDGEVRSLYLPPFYEHIRVKKVDGELVTLPPANKWITELQDENMRLKKSKSPLMSIPHLPPIDDSQFRDVALAEFTQNLNRTIATLNDFIDKLNNPDGLEIN